MTIQPINLDRPRYDVRKIVEALRRPQPDLFMVSAHRALRWAGAADNSREAIRRTVEAGIECIELDIQLTSDGHPVVFHDDGLGRCTDVGERNGRSDIYSPFTGRGYNPRVSDTPWKGCMEHLQLKEEHGKIVNETVLDLENVLNFIREEELNVVVMLDIKTSVATEPSYHVVKDKVNAEGINALEWCLWKIDAGWYGDTECLERSAWFQDAVSRKALPLLLPVLRPETARNIDPLQCAKAFSTKPYVVAFEVGLRGPGGYLEDVVQYLRSAESPVNGIGFFASLGDIHKPDCQTIVFENGQFGIDAGEKGDFRWSFSDNVPPKRFEHYLRPGDTIDNIDHRYNIELYHQMGYNWTITDHGVDVVRRLRKLGLRKGESRLYA